MPANNITALVHDFKNRMHPIPDLVVVEHHAKPDTPDRLSLMIYGKGLAVVTLQKDTHWRVSEIKKNFQYNAAKWPEQMTAQPTAEGALTIIASLVECVQKFDSEN